MIVFHRIMISTSGEDHQKNCSKSEATKSDQEDGKGRKIKKTSFEASSDGVFAVFGVPEPHTPLSRS